MSEEEILIEEINRLEHDTYTIQISTLIMESMLDNPTIHVLDVVIPEFPGYSLSPKKSIREHLVGVPESEMPTFLRR